MDVAIQPTMAGENAAAALPKVNAVPTAAPRIWVGNSSVLYPRPAPKLPVIRKFKTKPTQNRLRPRPSNRWHLDEMVVRIAGERMYLWRAVDHEGEVLDMLVQRRRDS